MYFLTIIECCFLIQLDGNHYLMDDSWNTNYTEKQNCNKSKQRVKFNSYISKHPSIYNCGDKLNHNKYMHTTYTYVTKLLQIQ
jgi:hypothetical protein